jgi:hypothetical protein
VFAPNKRQALVVFRRALEDATGEFGEVPVQTGELRVEYVNVYITARNIRIKEIDDERA